MDYRTLLKKLNPENHNTDNHRAYYELLQTEFTNELGLIPISSDYKDNTFADRHEVSMCFEFFATLSGIDRLFTIETRSLYGGSWSIFAFVDIKNSRVPSISFKSDSDDTSLDQLKAFINSDKVAEYFKKKEHTPGHQVKNKLPQTEYELYERLIRQPDFIKFLENRLQVVISNTGFKIVPKPTKD